MGEPSGERREEAERRAPCMDAVFTEHLLHARWYVMSTF